MVSATQAPGQSNEACQVTYRQNSITSMNLSDPLKLAARPGEMEKNGKHPMFQTPIILKF